MVQRSSAMPPLATRYQRSIRVAGTTTHLATTTGTSVRTRSKRTSTRRRSIWSAATGKMRTHSSALRTTAIYGPEDLDTVPTDLDNCSGHTGETHEFGTVYHYHLNYESPNLPECRTGATAQGKLTSPDKPDVTLPDGMGMGPGPEPGGTGVGPGGVSSGFAEAAKALGVSVDELLRVIGPPRPDFEAAEATLGTTVEALRSVLPPPPSRRP